MENFKMSNQIVVFTQEDKNKKAELLAKIGDALEDSEVAKLQSEIVKLNKKQKQATEQRGEFVTSIYLLSFGFFLRGTGLPSHHDEGTPGA